MRIFYLVWTARNLCLVVFGLGVSGLFHHGQPIFGVVLVSAGFGGAFALGRRMNRIVSNGLEDGTLVEKDAENLFFNDFGKLAAIPAMFFNLGPWWLLPLLFAALHGGGVLMFRAQLSSKQRPGSLMEKLSRPLF